MGWLREAPGTLPALAAVVLLVVWASSQVGYPLTHWAPGGLIVLALVGIAALARRPGLAELPLGVKLAVGCLALYTVLSFCSIAWADVPGDAWEGADRTLLYLLVFALFALWPARGASAALLLSLWTFATVALGAYVALRLASVTGSGFYGMFSDERLSYPAGYPNASAAQWMIAFWPALLLASGRSVPWALRGLLAGGAVLLADVALLSQSRGSVVASAVMLVLVFALVPGRVRLFATALPVAVGVAATAPLVLRVGTRIQDGASPYGAAHTAVAVSFAAAVAVGLAVAAGALAERRAGISAARSARRLVGALAWATLLAVVVGGLAAAGNPVARARHAWDSFKGGYAANAGETRLLSGLGSNRYDFYRVALDQFRAHPLVGIGADNYQEQYLAQGRSGETPRYPHSVELRVLSQTGIAGALLAAVGLAGALAAGWRAMRRRPGRQRGAAGGEGGNDPLARTVAAAALAGFGYWAVHGSADWFWEMAGLGAPAFAMLGIACSLAPRHPARARVAQAARVPVAAGRGPAAAQGPERAPADTGQRPGRAVAGTGQRPARALRGSRRALAALLAGALALACAYAFAAPWLSELQVQGAARIWPRAPLAAYAQLEEAASADPLSARPYLVAGSIALRFGDLQRAQMYFSRALGRAPNQSYATLELGAIASAAGEPGRAERLLRRAVRLAPREALYSHALRVVRSGGRVNVQALNGAIFARAHRLA